MSLTFLCLLSPLLVLIAFTIRASSPGPAIFRQPRAGRNGRLFDIWKFRTMEEGAEFAGPAITAVNDDRVTSIGRILRATKLDELPQFWNVLRGDMSLVGPRPQVARFVDHFDEDLRDVILSVRPGITGPTQLRFMNEERLLETATDREKFYLEHLLPVKCRLDAEYVRNRSLYGDAAILLATCWRFSWYPFSRNNRSSALWDHAVVQEVHADQEVAAETGSFTL